MFDFIDMIGSYNSRVVDRFEQDEGNLCVDTCSVTDGDHPYETGVRHELYNDGDWVIVEAYGTEEEAQVGHNKWVERMTKKRLPKELRDCQNSHVSQLCENLVFPRMKRKK